MNLEMLNLLDKFYALIWPLLRITAFLAFASIFSIRAVNLRIRMVLSLAFAFFISMQIDIPVIDPLTGPGLAEIFNQVFIGFAMGMIMQIATAGVVVAGQVVSGSMGLTMATLIDPNVGNVPVISGLFNVLGTLLFLAMGGHLIVFGILLDSFTVFPIGKSLMTQDVYGKMLAWSAMMFLASVLIVCQRGPGLCDPCGPQFEYFLGGFFRHVDGRLCHFVAGPSKYRGPDELAVGANLCANARLVFGVTHG